MEDVQLGLVSSAVVWYWVLFLGYFFIIPLSFSLFSPSLLVIDLASFIRISRFLSSVLPPLSCFWICFCIVIAVCFVIFA